VMPVALPAKGTAGGLVALRYRSTTLGIVATDIVVDQNGKLIARTHKNASVVDQDSLYSVAWHAPRAAAHGSVRFCVTLQNRTPGAPMRNYTSCAHIRLVARATGRKTGLAAEVPRRRRATSWLPGVAEASTMLARFGSGAAPKGQNPCIRADSISSPARTGYPL